VRKKRLLLNPLKGPGLDLYVKDKVTHTMKYSKFFNELSHVTVQLCREGDQQAYRNRNVSPTFYLGDN